jgi:CheY-like chemotaxis protein
MLGERITLELCCRPNIPAVAVDASMTEQIVMNLAVNARDAMPRGGTLHIETASAEIPVALARQHPDARAGSFVCLTVQDTGCGMERRVVQRIFEPFFTTKEIGKGTGLGLSTVYGIVRQHLGWIEVESEVGKGTTFKVFLPCADSHAGSDPMATAVTPEPVDGGMETILVVEDELSLLKVLSRVLQRYHYRVLIAASGAEALEVWDEHNGQIDLLLTDIVMPGQMTGQELVKELKKRKPALKVIMTSGYGAEAIGCDINQDDTSFLPKPYQPHMVAELVRKTLDGPGEHPAHNHSASGNPVLLDTATLVAQSPHGSSLQETRTANSTPG